MRVDGRGVVGNVVSSVAFEKVRVTRWRWPLAIVAAVVALALIGVWTAVRPASHAAQGQKWLTGVHFAGWLDFPEGGCTVTVVSEFMAITAGHCIRRNATLKLNVSALSTPGRVHAVKEFRKHPTLDVQAIFLRERTGLTVTPLQERVDRNLFYSWGYGVDWSNNPTQHLTRAEFSLPELCPEKAKGITATGADLCWQTTAQNSLCGGDSGAPVTQNGAIIAMVAAVDEARTGDCSTVFVAGAITISKMQPWLNQTIDDANPFPT